MPKSNIQRGARIKVGDLVTYRSIKEFSKSNLQQQISAHGVGIVVAIDEEYGKVYWIHAQQFLWVFTCKLIHMVDLEK